VPQRTNCLLMQSFWRGYFTVLSTQVNYFAICLESSVILIHSLWMKIFTLLWELFYGRITAPL
jgi:hypothetical protein